MARVIPPWLEVIPLVRSLLVIMDPGRDQDDEDTLVALNRFVRMGLMDVLGVVANLAPSANRARLARGTLDTLGLPEIPVGIGTGCTQPDDDGMAYQWAVSYLSPEDAVVDGKALLRRTLEGAQPGQIVLVLLSGLTDAYEIMREEPALFASRVRRVVFMGGVEFKRLALNMDQVRLYAPPPNFAKLTDSRAAAYIRIHGNESWELDALEPTVMAGLIRDAVEGIRNNRLWEADKATIDREKATLAKAALRWVEVETFLNNGREGTA